MTPLCGSAENGIELETRPVDSEARILLVRGKRDHVEGAREPADGPERPVAEAFGMAGSVPAAWSSVTFVRTKDPGRLAVRGDSVGERVGWPRCLPLATSSRDRILRHPPSAVRGSFAAADE